MRIMEPCSCEHCRRSRLQLLRQFGEVIPPNMTVATDNVVQLFQVEIRSLNGVHPETLKDVIQKKYEVTDIQLLAKTMLVHPA
jgi:hypothetical protein